MGRLTNLLRQRKKNLEDLIEGLESIDVIDLGMRLRISRIHGKPRYYCVPTAGNGSEEVPKQARYLRKDEIEFARLLAQRDYDIKVLKTAKQQLRMVDYMLKHFNEERLTDLYSHMSAERKALVEPRVPDLQRYIADWINLSYESGEFEATEIYYLTMKGEKVRSKSEKIIADRYASLNIPYHYEMPLLLNDRGQMVKRRPDFTLLNVQTGKVCYHEHFGMMGDPEYVRKMMQRIDLFERNEIYPGEKLLMTFESDSLPLDIRQIDRLIERYLI